MLIVLWSAILLHARWGGLVGPRGVAALAVAGNVWTAWSWFAVNELGIGLHTYGATEGVLVAFGLFSLSQMIVIGMGCLPKHLWRSFADTAAVKKKWSKPKARRDARSARGLEQVQLS